MGWLSRILLAGMVWISQLFPPSIGYGMGIVGVTLVVKLLFWPLNYRSTVSMRKMSALNPELKKLREKYKDDPQKMYRKQRSCSRTKSASLAAACRCSSRFQSFSLCSTPSAMPSSCAMPAFWAVDLSMPDDLFFTLFGLPIRPLALLMGARCICSRA